MMAVSDIELTDLDTQSLPEWYAYVPSKMDYSDLYSILAL